MLTKKIKYTDFLGTEREETFTFHLTKSELAEMTLSTEGGLDTRIRKLVEAKNVPEITALFKDIMLKSYGKISDDGSRFIKSKELSEEFHQSAAYDVLFMELIQNEKAASDFIVGIMPEDMKKQIADQNKVANGLPAPAKAIS